MSYSRITRLVATINKRCKRDSLAHAQLACTLVAGVVVMLEEYGEEELADRLEAVLLNRMLPDMAKRG